jgi:hypothetical protein
MTTLPQRNTPPIGTTSGIEENEPTPETMIVFPALPHGVCHIGELTAIIKDVVGKAAEREGESNAETQAQEPATEPE